MAVPTVPYELRKTLTDVGLEPLYRYLAQDLFQYLNTRLNTQGDVTVATAAKGVVLTNAAGTVTKRVRLNNAGTGFIFEDV